MDESSRNSLNRYSVNHHPNYSYSDNGEDEEVNYEDDDDNYDLERYKKKRKWKSLEAAGYEFSSPNSPEWTERTTSLLLDVWGDRFLQLGRKSIRSEDWHDVANKVSQDVRRLVRTDAQCRSRLDTLKKRYMKEKMKFQEKGIASNWVFFKKMDTLLSPSHNNGLSCGLDSGEYVFMNSNVYLKCSNGMDEMRDSPENSESSDGLPPRIAGFKEEDGDEGSSFRLLADSIQKFGEIYERIEGSKRQQMRELEKLRVEFHRDLELQKKEMLEHTQAEIERLQQSYDDDDSEDDEEDEEINVPVNDLSE